MSKILVLILLYSFVILCGFKGTTLFSYAFNPIPQTGKTVSRSANCLPTSSALFFIKNEGQVLNINGQLATDVLFYAQSGNVSVFLRKSGVSYVFSKVKIDSLRYGLTDPFWRPLIDSISGSDNLLPRDSIQQFRMDVNYVGANLNPIVLGEFGQGIKHTYYYGPNSTALNTVFHYQQIRYKDIYPNTDLVFYFSNTKSGIKYDFIVRPGGNPSLITEQYFGADTLGLFPDGCVMASTAVGGMGTCSIVAQAPLVYQKSVMGHRSEVRARYTCNPQQRTVNYNISPNNYDVNKDLIIDPFISWSSYYGEDDFGGWPNNWKKSFVNANVDKEDRLWVVYNTTQITLPADFDPITTPLNVLYTVELFSSDNQLLATYTPAVKGDRSAIIHLPYRMDFNTIAADIETDNQGRAWIWGTTKDFFYLNSFEAYCQGLGPGQPSMITRLSCRCYEDLVPSGYPNNTHPQQSAYYHHSETFLTQLKYDAVNKEIVPIFSRLFSSLREQTAVALAIDPVDNSIWALGTTYQFGSIYSFYRMTDFQLNDPSKKNVWNPIQPNPSTLSQGYGTLTFVAKFNNNANHDTNNNMVQMPDSDPSTSNLRYGGNLGGNAVGNQNYARNYDENANHHGELEYFTYISGNRAFNFGQDISVIENNGESSIWVLGVTNSENIFQGAEIKRNVSPDDQCLNELGIPYCADYETNNPTNNHTISTGNISRTPFQKYLSKGCNNGSSVYPPDQVPNNNLFFDFKRCPDGNDDVRREICEHCQTDYYVVKFKEQVKDVYYWSYLGGSGPDGSGYMYPMPANSYIRGRISASKDHVWIAGSTVSYDFFNNINPQAINDLQYAPHVNTFYQDKFNGLNGFVVRLEGDGKLDYYSYIGESNSINNSDLVGLQQISGLYANPDGTAWISGYTQKATNGSGRIDYPNPLGNNNNPANTCCQVEHDFSRQELDPFKQRYYKDRLSRGDAFIALANVPVNGNQYVGVNKYYHYFTYYGGDRQELTQAMAVGNTLALNPQRPENQQGEVHINFPVYVLGITNSICDGIQSPEVGFSFFKNGLSDPTAPDVFYYPSGINGSPNDVPYSIRYRGFIFKLAEQMVEGKDKQCCPDCPGPPVPPARICVFPYLECPND